MYPTAGRIVPRAGCSKTGVARFWKWPDTFTFVTSWHRLHVVALSPNALMCLACSPEE